MRAGGSTHTLTRLGCTPQMLAGQKKQMKRVKWADHFGGTLTASKTIEGEGEDLHNEEEATLDPSVSWTDRRRRDRLREKELLAQAK